MIVAEADGTTRKAIITIVSEDKDGETNSCVMTNGSPASIKHAFISLFKQGDTLSEIAKSAFLEAAITGSMNGVNVGIMAGVSKENNNDNKENN